MYKIENDVVFIYGRPMKNADASTFVVLNALFAKDCRSVYVMGSVLKSANPATFKALKCELKITKYPGGRESTIGGGYGKDDQNVFWYELTVGQGMVVKSADPATFEPIGHEWGADKKSVYYMGRKVPKAKPEGFRVVGRLYGQCGTVGYYGNEECQRPVVGLLRIMPDDLALGIWAEDDVGVFNRSEASTRSEYDKDVAKK